MGRPKKGAPPGRPPSKASVDTKIKTLVVPVTARDEEIVTCAKCNETLSFRLFRLHNIEKHYNIAKTTDDETVLDHKFFSRKLIEMSKLIKIKTFFCPTEGCDSKYKSSLGLAYHLETCGKTVEEVAACLVECNICKQKFTLPNLPWHKKSAHTVQKTIDLTVEETVPIVDQSRKRKSAVKAREFLKEISDPVPEDSNVKVRKSIQLDPDVTDDDFVPTKSSSSGKLIKKENISSSDDEEEGVSSEEEAKGKQKPKRKTVKKIEVTPSVDFILNSDPPDRRDFFAFTQRAVDPKFREHLDPNPWGAPPKITTDPLGPILPHKVNKLNNFEKLNENESMSEFLPRRQKSVEFSTKAQVWKRKNRDKERDFKVKETSFRKLNLFESWSFHTDESNLLIFTGGPITCISWHPSELIFALVVLLDGEKNLMKENKDGKCSIQFYSNFHRRERRVDLSVDENKKSNKKTQDEIDDTNKAGSLNPAFTLRLILPLSFGTINFLQWSNFTPCKLDSFSKSFGYIAAAFSDSSIRIYGMSLNDMEMEENVEVEGGRGVSLYAKRHEIELGVGEEQIWIGQCTVFDWHEDNKILVSGYASGYIALFNLFTTSTLLKTTKIFPKAPNTPSITSTISPFWLFKPHLGPLTSIVIEPGNGGRYFHSAAGDRVLKSWDLDLRAEVDSKKLGWILDMTWVRGWVHLAMSFDIGIANPGSQYNHLRYYPITCHQGRPNTLEYFNITSVSVFEGMTLCGTETGRVSVSYYDSFWRECDYDRNKKKRNILNLSKVELDKSSFTPYEKEDVRVNLKETDQEPRIILSFPYERLRGSHELEPTEEEFENNMRFYKYICVNKVTWSPKGSFITIGYQNGLLAIIPNSYDKLYG